MSTPSPSVRRVLAIAVTLLLTLLLVPRPALAVSTAHRLVADGPVETAALLSAVTYPEGASEVLIGTAEAFPDNLASGVLQDSRPLLLTDPDGLSAGTAEEITRLGATSAILLGGEAALTAAVADDLTALGLTVDRLSGPTRIETAIAVAASTGATQVQIVRAFGSADSADESQAFADSLTSGAYAADAGLPVVLTQTEVLTPSTAEYLANAGITDVTIVGGTAAVSEEVADAIADEGINVDRVAGPTRFDTAVAVADARGVDDPATITDIVLTDGQVADGWISGFTAAGLSAASNAPLVLSNGDDLPAPTADLLNAVAAEGNDVLLTCTPSVTGNACEAAATILGADVVDITLEDATTPDEDPPVEDEGDVTGAPELVSAVLTGSTDMTTSVDLVFDEPIAGVLDPTRVFAISPYFDLDEIARGQNAAVDAADPTLVHVELDRGGILTPRLVTLYLATGLVDDVDGFANTPATHGLQDVTLADGLTDGPDLLSIVVDPGATAGGDGDETVDFVFDEPITLNGADFRVFPAAGPSVGYIGGGIAVVDDVIARVSFPFGQLSDAVIADLSHALAVAGSVLDADGIGNSPRQATVAPGGTAGPDLIEAEVRTDTFEVVYRFDEPVSIVNADEFWVVNVQGETVGGGGFVTSTTQTGPQEITVTFGGGTVNDGIVAAHVRIAAVDNAGGITAPRTTIALNPAYAAGYTSGPDAVSAERRVATDGVGNPIGTELVLEFDRPVDVGAVAPLVYAANGSATTLNLAHCADGDGPNQVSCVIPNGDPTEQALADAVAVGLPGGVADPAGISGPASAPATLALA